MKIAIGSDHAGFELKEKLKKILETKNISCNDVGPDNDKLVDYPDYAEKTALLVASGICKRGILICGSGVGMAIVANKIPGVRAVLCSDVETARLSREHNDTNVLSLGARKINYELAIQIIDVWLNTDFSKDERHNRRVQKIKDIEKKYLKDLK
ncbi:MAG: ribose 5-phosphate isomerase B [Actinobacteria bacterium]|nr:ribose 5-phosphate isomerase B [Actinomycetota bacterium]